jgi:ParB family chromosome partitioning protein
MARVLKNRGGEATLLGVDMASLKDGVEKSDALKAMNAGKVMLPVGGGKQAAFELVTIEPLKIASDTEVLATNERDQELLNRTSLSDILPSVEQEGQVTPAIGYYVDGKIVVIEGSRRRMSCLLAKKPFLVYVTESALSGEQAKNISVIGNKYRVLSLYERGRVFERMLSEGLYDNGKALCAAEGVDEATLSIARKAFGLPRELILLFPSVNMIGKPTVNMLADIVSSVSGGELVRVIGKLGGLGIEYLAEQCKSDSENGLNSAMLVLLKGEVLPLMSKKAEGGDGVKLCAGGTATKKKTRKGFNYSIVGVSAVQCTEIDAFINTLK